MVSRARYNNTKTHVGWVLEDFYIDSIFHVPSLVTPYFDYYFIIYNLYVFNNWTPIIRTIRKMVLIKV